METLNVKTEILKRIVLNKERAEICKELNLTIGQYNGHIGKFKDFSTHINKTYTERSAESIKACEKVLFYKLDLFKETPEDKELEREIDLLKNEYSRSCIYK